MEVHGFQPSCRRWYHVMMMMMMMMINKPSLTSLSYTNRSSLLELKGPLPTRILCGCITPSDRPKIEFGLNGKHISTVQKFNKSETFLCIEDTEHFSLLCNSLRKLICSLLAGVNDALDAFRYFKSADINILQPLLYGNKNLPLKANEIILKLGIP